MIFDAFFLLSLTNSSRVIVIVLYFRMKTMLSTVAFGLLTLAEFFHVCISCPLICECTVPANGVEEADCKSKGLTKFPSGFSNYIFRM